jgi:hypothetical protein
VIQPQPVLVEAVARDGLVRGTLKTQQEIPAGNADHLVVTGEDFYAQDALVERRRPSRVGDGEDDVVEAADFQYQYLVLGTWYFVPGTAFTPCSP